MTTHSTEYSAKLDRMRIATPCPISWDQMTGDSRVRFCDHCRLNVYNISELSRIEAEKLIASTEGRLCARLFRRNDGTILTKDCPVGLRALRRRAAKRGAAVFAAVVSLTTAVFGQQSSAKDKKSCTPQTRITRTDGTAEFASGVSGTVVDPAGMLVPKATVTLTNDETKDSSETSTNAAGRFEFASMAPGKYSIDIKQKHFVAHRIVEIKVEKDKVVDLQVILQIPGEQMIGVVGIDSLIDTPPGTTIINEQMIRRLPYKK
jgi:hypothetical protein